MTRSQHVSRVDTCAMLETLNLLQHLQCDMVLFCIDLTSS